MKTGNQSSSTSSSNMKQEQQYDQQQGHNSTSGGTGPAGNQPSGGTGPVGNQPSAIVQEQGMPYLDLKIYLEGKKGVVIGGFFEDSLLFTQHKYFLTKKLQVLQLML